jgi:regulator of sirC expression with transglutaminase-like and TPR domain
MLAREEHDIDLARAALLVACEEYPDLDVDVYLGRLDEMGRELRGRLPRRPAPARAVEVLNRYLFEEAGFTGNQDDYYDPRNSFLNEVMDRRTGIPITLSTVYMELGRRAGLRVEGVGFPGHFVVRVASPEGGLLLDPFNGGALLSEQDCQERLDRVYGKPTSLLPAFFAACGPRAILGRTLRNLKTIYLKAEEWLRALAVLDLLLLVNPRSAEDLRDRGLVHVGLDCYERAVRDLTAYLEQAPKAPEATSLRERIAELKRKARLIN